MFLTRHKTPNEIRWACEGRFLPPSFNLGLLLELKADVLSAVLGSLSTGEPAHGELLAPVEATHEVWASGVTYARSREARKAESETADIYEKIYAAERPELFFKTSGWRVSGHGQPIRIRTDSHWNVPEPELALVVNRYGEIVGYCVGNDMSSRSIEGENPLYLPQAKIYRGSCALGPGIRIAPSAGMTNLEIRIWIQRAEATAFTGRTSTSRMNRTFEQLVSYLTRELDFPQGVFLMTGTGVVPPEAFTLMPGDRVRIAISDMVMENPVVQ